MLFACRLAGLSALELSPPDWEGLAALFVQACRNSLPLLDALPRDDYQAADAEGDHCVTRWTF
jgi:hypothetical protein